MHILLCKYYSKDDSRNAPKWLRTTVIRFETMDPERREGRGQGGGGESREINEGRGRLGGGEQRGRGGWGGGWQHGRGRASRQAVSGYFSWCMPGLDQACERIWPLLPGQGQYSLWCLRSSLACPRPTTGCWGRIIIVVAACCIVLYSTGFCKKKKEA